MYFHGVLITTFIITWVWSAINPLFPQDWFLENLLVVGFLPFLLYFGPRLKPSRTAYTCITLFLILHVIGSHYTYSHVPFGASLETWLGSTRNMYDRLVHFAFGLLFAIPIRETFTVTTKIHGPWSYSVPFFVVLGFAGLYEVVEWLAMLIVDKEAGIAFLGTQGDIWDAQKDMGLAGIGVVFGLICQKITQVLFTKKESP